MKILSSYFGELDVPEENIVRFNSTIPGFENKHKYFIIREDKLEGGKDDNGLFCWLHNIEDVDVAFALLDVFKVKADYQPEIGEDYLDELKYVDGDNIVVYNIVNIPENINNMTVNLLAPIVINLSKMTGVQAVLNNEAYSLKHRIFDEIEIASAAQEKKEV